ncbi:MAG: ester cyclase [Pseudomonadota bacterium]
MTLSPEARALRGFAIDFLTSHDVSAVEWVMDPDYRLSIGGHVFDGRDTQYLPATAAQLDQFPGLTVTVHDVILGTDGVAMRFTEHGASLRDGGRVAAWRGITLFRLHEGRLIHGWAEEDYFARKRQLKRGVPDPVAPPALAPWDQPVLPGDPAVEAIVRDWVPTILSDPVLDPVLVDGPGFDALVSPDRVTITHLFSAATRVAAHLEVRGGYRGGFPDIDPALAGMPVVLRLAAMIDVCDDTVVRAQVSGDRLGLHRQLLARAKG